MNILDLSLSVVTIVSNGAWYIYNGSQKKNFKSLSNDAKTIELLKSIVEISFGKGDLKDSANSVIDLFKSQYEINYCSLFVKRDDNERLVCVSTDVESNFISDIESEANKLLVEMKSKDGIIERSQKFLPYPSASERNIKYRYFIPLEINEAVIGAILIENTAYDNERLEDGFLQLSFDYLAVVLKNLLADERISNLALKDGLTGIWNRNYMSSHIKEQIDIEDKFTIAILDIDHFKKFNDTYGHLFGDLVLKKVSNTIANELHTINPKNEMYRWGGEEFCIFLHDLDTIDGFNIIDYLREVISNIVVEDGQGVQAKVTASFGLCEYPSNGKTVAELVKCADEALYYSKENGRNRVTIYGKIN
jgi:diguanylate cyclase (GGDEF)-like protein